MKIKSLFESKFIKVFDLQYQEDRHYYNATRRDENDLVAAKSTEEFKKMLPDAVSCVVYGIRQVMMRNQVMSHVC